MLVSRRGSPRLGRDMNVLGMRPSSQRTKTMPSRSGYTSSWPATDAFARRSMSDLRGGFQHALIDLSTSRPGVVIT